MTYVVPHLTPADDPSPKATEPSPDPTGELARLRADVAQLQDTLASLLGQPSQGPTRTALPPVPSAEPARVATLVAGPANPALTDRRSLLRRAGIGMAGAVAGGAALALTDQLPAAAANGDAVTCGQVRTASSSTDLRYNGPAIANWHQFAVQDGTSGLSLFPSAVAGLSSGDTSHGVLGQTTVDNGFGVVGLGLGTDTVGGFFSVGAGGKSNLRLNTSGPRPHTRNSNGTYASGDIVADQNDDLWLCVVAGSTGATATWRKIGGPATAGQLHLHSAPKRIYDSRPGNNPIGGVKAPLASGATRTINGNVFIGPPAPQNPIAVPLTATAVLVNATVVNTSASGFIALFDGTIAWPGTSSFNWFQAGSVIGGTTVVKVTDSKIRAYCSTGSQTDFLLDIIGWYE